MAGLRPLELWAAQCIERTLESVSVVQYDDGSREGVHDLNIVRDGEIIGAVEVTSATDGDTVALWNFAYPRGSAWVDSTLSKAWVVRLKPGGNLKNIRRFLPKLLKELEVADVAEVPRIRRGYSESRSPFPLVDLLEVVSARQVPSGSPGKIYIQPYQPVEKSGGWGEPDGDVLPPWIESWISEDRNSDNLRKLAKSGAIERHLFVVVPGLSSTALFPITNALFSEEVSTPTRALRLPPEVTHFWCLSTFANGKGFYWSPGGWQTFDKTWEELE